MDGVDLSVEPGEILSVIGPNGAGKTTLFNLITGLIPPDAGEVAFAGQPIAGLAPDRIAELGIARTYQNQRVFANLTVRENVLLGAHRRLAAARSLGLAAARSAPERPDALDGRAAAGDGPRAGAPAVRARRGGQAGGGA